MTLQSAAEQALERLKTLHIEAGECSHPEECPTQAVIDKLEWALKQTEQAELTITDNNQFALQPETLVAIGRMRCHGSS